MIAISSSKVRSNFKQVCNKVIDDVEAIIITRTRGKNVVMVSEDEYNNLIENFRIFSDSTKYNKIKNGISQLENEQFTKRELVNE
ncbi:type II toxin-antitoxin system Phd/YefM family antitoxin [Clostridiaceae bacterium HSG29]|nr:type II toxin-antitoxin system Phd/YefM family antitoxin [Clostridiaceae bacterium HSG29]